MKQNYILLICLFSLLFFAGSLLGQVPSELALLEKIASQQNSATTKNAIPGLFTSYFVEKGTREPKYEDDNIFYTALISYELGQIRKYMGEKEQVLIDQIISRSEEAYRYFKHEKRLTYNFWRKDSLFRFPYFEGNILIDRKNAIADDLDDTSLILLARNVTKGEAEEAHGIMQSYRNKPGEKVFTLEKYENIPAYSVWYGIKTPVVFDVCVSANTLTFVNSYGLKWTKTDSATMYFVQKVIENDDHLNSPLEVSFFYGENFLIIYHLARLLSSSKDEGYLRLKEKIKNDAMKLMVSADSQYEKLLLSISILKLGYQESLFILNQESISNLNRELASFYSADYTPFLSGFQLRIFKLLGFTNYDHTCEAHTNTLLLTYMVLKRISAQNINSMK